MRMSKYVPISLYAGRPGSGKTQWARREIAHILTDPNNVVFYIGFAKEFEKIADDAMNLPGKVLFAEDGNAAEAIGRAISLANKDSMVTFGDQEDIGKREETKLQVYIFYDQCRYVMAPGSRDLLVAASKAGIYVNVFCQYYHQVDKNDKNWLKENCVCYVISKTRPPRLANEKDMSVVYC